MSRTRTTITLLLGLLGTAVLVSLGLWQVDRMGQKGEIIAGIEARIHHAPTPIPPAPTPEADRYRPVTVIGRFDGTEVHVLSSIEGTGPGVRVIAAFETDDRRRILVDRGFLPQAAARDRSPAPGPEIAVRGNLDWPRDSDRFTPDPDLDRNLWFAREVAPIAAHLDTEPVMVVLRQTTENRPAITPVPLDSADVRDDHLGYAITWFSLAVVWAGMTAALLWRMRREHDQDRRR